MHKSPFLFFFFQLSNSVTTFVQTSMLWPQAPEHPSCRLLQKIKSCAYHQKKISSSSPCPFKITHRLSMHSVQAWAVWQASTKTWSRFLNSRNTEIPLCLALPTRGYCLSLQFKARHLSVKSQPGFSRKPKNLLRNNSAYYTLTSISLSHTLYYWGYFALEILKILFLGTMCTGQKHLQTNRIYRLLPRGAYNQNVTNSPAGADKKKEELGEEKEVHRDNKQDGAN